MAKHQKNKAEGNSDYAHALYPHGRGVAKPAYDIVMGLTPLNTYILNLLISNDLPVEVAAKLSEEELQLRTTQPPLSKLPLVTRPGSRSAAGDGKRSRRK